MRKLHRIGFLLFLFAALLRAAPSRAAQIGADAKSPSSGVGVLLMAHGGSKAWNDEVISIARRIDAEMPTEVAFGMAARATLQEGIEKLIARGAKEIIAVPLFVSSHSSVIESTEYLLGLRADPPADLAIFSSMAHHMNNQATPDPAAASEGMRPVKCPVPLRMAPALGRHPVVADLLLDRADAISEDPAGEVLILLAHGPESDEQNALWLADMEVLAKSMAARRAYARIDCLTLRDDAEASVREQATAALRKDVQGASEEGYRVLIVPLLLSYGGIESGIRKRLEGLDYKMSLQGLLPDPRLIAWVFQSLREARDTPKQPAENQRE